jgi:Na+/H+ antiporter NhaD/arsenite permease-like protein
MMLLVLRNMHAIIWVLNVKEIFQPSFWIFKGLKGEISHGINWQTVIFIAGMMVMIEGLSEVGFFRWLCLLVAKFMRYRANLIFIAFMLLSGFLSMFIDSITVMLFLATVTIELARLLKFDPVPFIIAEIFAANTGGSATMCGDPPNIIIGTSFGLSFFDFLVNTGPIAWLGMLVAVGFFYLVFRKELKAGAVSGIKYPEPQEAVKNWRLFKVYVVVFLLVIGLLVTHNLTGFSVALIGCVSAVLVLLFAPRNAKEIIKRVDYKTLLFFIGLFICVGGLEYTGVLQTLADFIGRLSKGNVLLVTSIILWFSAFASAIVDNIPFAAAMVPLIFGLAKKGMPLTTLSWALALGTDIGGNGTPIGASANVVGISICEKEGYRVGWPRYCKYALVAMIMVIALCNLFLAWRY